MYRFFVTINSSVQEVHPLNFMQTSLVDSQENGQIFYRRKFSGTLRFYNNEKESIDDFDLFYLVEVVDPCTEIYLLIEQKDSGADTWHTYWEGYFSTTDGRFDLDNCTFDITPKPYDNYKAFTEKGEDEYNILYDLDASKVTVNTLAPAEQYNENLFVIDVIEYLVAQIAPAATVTSWFLNNDTNPVLGGTNKYRYLTIAQKSDIKRPNASNPAPVGMMSFNQMMEILKAMYNVFWTYDGTTVRIEHYDYWGSTAGLDLTTQKLSEKSNKYSYLKGNMPKYEKFSFMEAYDFSYVTHTISYESPCLESTQSDEVAINVTTDLSYIIYCMATSGYEGNISDDGWVVLANELSGGNYYVYYGTPLGSAVGSYNYPNSWADLIRSFFMHGRVLMIGFIQSLPYDFISVRKTKQQEIKAIVCWEDGYDPNDYITTELGEDWFGGQKGFVEESALHPDGRIDFRLLYGEDKNTDVELPTRTKNLHIIIDTSSYTEIISVLSEPNVYDTYYWILWNDGVVGEVCQEIMIPAGTVYQEDVSDLAEIFASIKFNLTDSSLTGWHVIYNDNAPITATLDCPAVPPVPPAVPAATTMIGAGQLSDCAVINVSWNASALATYYQLYRNPDFSLANNWVLIDSTVNTYYDDPNQCDQAGYTFTYKVKACNISGCSADSDTTSHDVMCL